MHCSSRHVPVPGRDSPMNEEAIERKCTVYSCSLFVQEQVSFGDANVIVECTFEPLSLKFLRVILDAFWRVRIDLYMHGFVQPQTQLSIHRSIFVHSSFRSVFEALEQLRNGRSGNAARCIDC